MTASIENSDHQLRSATPPPSTQTEGTSVGRLITAVQSFTAVAALAGVACLAVGFARNEWRFGVAGIVLAGAAAIGGAVCVINALIADRHEFYRRGKIDGWYQGWRGMPPESDDPLLPRLR